MLQGLTSAKYNDRVGQVDKVGHIKMQIHLAPDAHVVNVDPDKLSVIQQDMMFRTRVIVHARSTDHMVVVLTHAVAWWSDALRMHGHRGSICLARVMVRAPPTGRCAEAFPHSRSR